MNRWMRMDENDDGTTTITVCFEEGVEEQLLIPIDFNEMMGMVASGDGTVDVASVAAEGIAIPNSVD